MNNYEKTIEIVMNENAEYVRYGITKKQFDVIFSLINSNRFIDAVKEYRGYTGYSLFNSKTFCEELRNGKIKWN